MSERRSLEEKLTILLREIWESYQTGTTLEGPDIEVILSDAGLSELYSAMEDDEDEGIETGDEILGLTKEAQELLEKYPNDC